MKNVCKISIILGLLIVSNIFAQDYCSGKIIFNNSNSLSFFSVGGIIGKHMDYSSLFSGIQKNGSPMLRVKYNNTYRDISYRDIEYFEIKRYEPNVNALKNVLIEIKTKTGIIFENELTMLVMILSVKTLDDLSGELTNIDRVSFCEINKLNIRKIIFD